jgi:hypothetical protein
MKTKIKHLGIRSLVLFSIVILIGLGCNQNQEQKLDNEEPKEAVDCIPPSSMYINKKDIVYYSVLLESSESDTSINCYGCADLMDNDFNYVRWRNFSEDQECGIMYYYYVGKIYDHNYGGERIEMSKLMAGFYYDLPPKKLRKDNEEYMRSKCNRGDNVVYSFTTVIDGPISLAGYLWENASNYLKGTSSNETY